MPRRPASHRRVPARVLATALLVVAATGAAAVAQGDSARFTVTFRLGGTTLGPTDVVEAVVPLDDGRAARPTSWIARLRGAFATPSPEELWVTLRPSPVASRLGRLAGADAAHAAADTCELVAVDSRGAPLRTLLARGCAVARVEAVPASARQPAAVRVRLTFDQLTSH